MKKSFIIQALFTAFLITVYSSSSNAQTNNIDMRSYVTPDKKIYNQGEKISIKFSGFPGFQKDWIGIYKQNELNRNFITWKYTGGNEQGVVDFEVPIEPGRYEFRGFANDGYDRFVTSGTITVRSADITAYNTDWSGTWRTNYNNLTLNISGNTVWGTYGDNDGKVEGIVNGNIITGWWKRSNGGSGRFEFRMSADGNSYTGKWGANEEIPDKDWNGTKVITNRRTNYNSTQTGSNNPAVTIKPAANSRITENDLAGIWDATGYTCESSIAVEKIKITVTGNKITAVKITGDNCVPAGEITWEGTLSGDRISGRGRVSSGPGTPRSWYNGITITVIDKNTLQGFLGVTYRRH